jgi:hypothetical protein
MLSTPTSVNRHAVGGAPSRTVHVRPSPGYATTLIMSSRAPRGITSTGCLVPQRSGAMRLILHCVQNDRRGGRSLSTSLTMNGEGRRFAHGMARLYWIIHGGWSTQPQRSTFPRDRTRCPVAEEIIHYAQARCSPAKSRVQCLPNGICRYNRLSAEWVEPRLEIQ